MERNKKLILLLTVLLILSVGYIVFEKYVEAKEKEKLEMYQQGYQQGYQQAINQLIQNTKTCKPIPVYSGNESVKVIAIDCLNLNLTT